MDANIAEINSALTSDDEKTRTPTTRVKVDNNGSATAKRTLAKQRRHRRVPFYRRSSGNAIMVKDRRLARAKWLAEHDAEIDANIAEMNSVSISDNQKTMAPLTKVKVDSDGPDMANRILTRRRCHRRSRFSRRLSWIRWRLRIVRRRSLSGFWKFLGQASARETANIKYYTRRDSKGDSNEVVEQTNDVLSSSTGTSKRSTAPRVTMSEKDDDEGAASFSRGHRRRGPFRMHVSASRGHLRRRAFAMYHPDPLGMTRRQRLKLFHRTFAARPPWNLVRIFELVDKEQESLWSTMRPSTKQDLSSRPTRHPRPADDGNSQRLVEMVRGFLNGDTRADEESDGYDEGTYKPFKG
jgi:hypothetical protein